MKKKQSLRDMCTTGVFAAVVAVLSWISIPMPQGVPATLQTFAVPLAGVVLGPRRGTAAVFTYVLMGAVGLPVFSGFSGGLGALLGLSGGFLWAFPLMALCAGLGARRGTVQALVLGLSLGILADYSAGMLQFMLVSGQSLKTSFFSMVVPFLPAEAIKATLAGVIGMRLRRVLPKSGMLPAPQPMDGPR